MITRRPPRDRCRSAKTSSMTVSRTQIILDYAKWTALSATRSGAPIKSRGDVYPLLDAVTFAEVLTLGLPISRLEFDAWHEAQTLGICARDDRIGRRRAEPGRLGEISCSSPRDPRIARVPVFAVPWSIRSLPAVMIWPPFRRRSSPAALFASKWLYHPSVGTSRKRQSRISHGPRRWGLNRENVDAGSRQR
jgi:hypothetical protein